MDTTHTLSLKSRVASAPQPRTVELRTLMRGQTEMQILHRGETYRLRITRNGKLILTK
jgi:hemin uptake protein HemP